MTKALTNYLVHCSNSSIVKQLMLIKMDHNIKMSSEPGSRLFSKLKSKWSSCANP